MARHRFTRPHRSAWNRPPVDDAAASSGERAGEGELEDGAAGPQARVADEIARVGGALRGHLAKGASRVGASVQAGLGRVGDALEDPGEGSQALMERADLPELHGEAPLVSRAMRLDREADLWRGVALRQLERAAWTGRLIVIGGAVALLGEVALAAIGGFRALFGGALAAAPPLLLGISAAILALGTVCAAWALSRGRQSQIEIARSALVRADLAELRLHRVACLLELRASSPERYTEAIERLEREVPA
ncbi:MAG: hypothetical protein IT372_40185 [Polyangiaceae bacterium]|nr:hypothetical protein [Polyangiaceae bacterium]